MGTDRATGRAHSQALSLPAAANDPSAQLALAPVRVLTLNRGAERVSRQGESNKPDELWQGSGYPSSGEADDDIPLYLRLAQPQPLVAELVCSVIGRALGLPMPEPFLVEILPGDLPGSRLAPSAAMGMSHWAFASLDLGAETFTQLLNRDSASADKLLREWEHLVPVAVFDEWLANPDRNLGNILFVANALWLIDHAEAFGGSMRKLWSLAEIQTEPFANQLGDLVNRISNLQQRVQHLEKAKSWLRNPAATLPLEQALACAGVSRWHTAAEQAELLDFVETRLNLAYTLLCHRLGTPTLLPPGPAGGSARRGSGPSSNSRRS